MSDVTDLFEGKFGTDPLKAVEAFSAKEWTNLTHLYANLPADLQPAAQLVVDDAKAVLVAAAEWGGTAASAYIAANGGNLATEVLNIMSGLMGGATPASAAGQDTVSAATKLLQAVIAHAVMSFVNATAPPAPGAQ